MSNKKLTPHQLRKGLSYVQEGKPDFMKMLTGQSSSASSSNASHPHYKKPIGIEAKFEHDDDEDDEDGHDLLNLREEERPSVVVLKDGKHLDERQARNVLKNLPPGLSEAEIQTALENAEKEGSTSSEEEDDAVPVDENGKILFRKPKSKAASVDTTTKASAGGSKKRTLEESLLGEAKQKVEALKKKKKEDSKEGGITTIKKKSSKAKATSKSLLSFDDEE
ncbi:hypothetical protein DFQ26_008049 [Actinomortierella ambigua]|nr:hypothetical protein DFQ26_008049 [Actinomortierella ambigua]